MAIKKQNGGLQFSDLLSPSDASSDLNETTNLLNTILDKKPTEWKPNNIQYVDETRVNLFFQDLGDLDLILKN